MFNQYVWIGIAVGVFIAGIGIGYAFFMNTYNPYGMMMQPQFFNQMMTGNPQFSNQYLGYMMQTPQLRQQMYNYMFQNKDFMYGMMGNSNFQNQYMGPWMMQNPQFRQQYMSPYLANPQSNYTGIQRQPGYGMMGNGYNQGYQMGPGMMYGSSNQAFKTISVNDAEALTQLPNYAQVSKENNTITFNSRNVNVIALSMMSDDAKNMTGSSLPPYAKGDVFVIGNMINPTLVLNSGTQLNVTSINLDEDMSHNFVIITSAPPYSYTPMHSMMYGIVSMMPVLPNDDKRAGFAYELSYQVTLSQPGTYWYVCTYPGHAEEGMYGKIIVQ